MAQVPVSPGQQIAVRPLSGADLQPANFGAAGEAIGQSAAKFGNAVGDYADVQNRVAEIHDEAAVKDMSNGVVGGTVSDLYTSDTAFFKQQGKNALDAKIGVEERLTERVANAREALQNDRQRRLFDQAMIPQKNSWDTLVGEHANRETLRYGVDQADARVNTALDAGIAAYPVDPNEGERQLATVLSEIARSGNLQGWAPEVIEYKKHEAQTKLLGEVVSNKQITDPSGAWDFLQQNKERMNAEVVTRLETELRPRLISQQGTDLFLRIAGSGPEKMPVGTTVDPLAPLSTGGRPSPDLVWSRMVGPDGRGGAEGGTNSDGTFRTSPKGAIGPAQVMPGTAPEAAALAGLPYDEQRYKTDASYNLALGRAYFNKQLGIFGDPVLAAAAYNAGAGRVRSALQKGGQDGWLDHVPAETRRYVAAVAGGPGTAKGSSGSPPSSLLASQLRTLDSLDVPEEVRDVAREKLIRRASDASLIAKSEHDQWLNAFQLSLHDGSAGLADIHAARSSGQLTDYGEIKTAEDIVKERDKGTEDLVNYQRMTSDPHFVFNQFDDTQRKAVEAGVKAQGSTPEAAFSVWQKTGILAKTGAVALRGALVSTSGKAVEEAANIAGNMLRRNPNAFAGVEGQSEIEHAATSFNHYVYDLGMAPTAAASRVAQENDPKFKEQAKYTDPQRQDAMKQLRQNGGAYASNAFSGASFPNPEQQEEANQTYHEMIVDRLAHGVDLSTAQAQAGAQLRKVYAVNKQGHIVKYAPEAAYPPIGGSYDYIYDDAGHTVQQETGKTPTAVNLVPIPGVTDEDFRTGRLPRYRLLFSYMSHGQRVTDMVPGEFAADVNAAAKQVSTQHRRSFAQERRQAVAREALYGGATVLPGIGPVR